MHKINFKAAIWKEEKYYVSQCLNIDVASFGKTKKQALSNLQEAVELYLENTSKPKLNKVERADLVSFKLDYA